MRRIAIYLLCIFMLLPVVTMTAQPGYNYSKLQREKLNRGVVAIRENPSEVIVSWRYLSSDPIQTGFNVYRDGKKLTDTPITVSTLFRDKNNSQKTAVYEVRPVLKGKETHHIDGTYTFPENAPLGYLEIPLQKPADGITPAGDTYTYSPNDASIGDVDGDGEYEIILKWDPSNSHDNAHEGYTGEVYIDCYRMNGEQLWRINLGKNIRAGAHYTQFMVYDLDGDGKLMKTFQGDKVTLKAGETKTVKASAILHNLHFWSWGYGYLYTVKTALKDDNNQIFDEVSTRTGFRKTRFAEGKIWLNDRVIQMKGYAQRTSNEWPAVGLSVPAWLSDFSNDLMVKGNANLVRWMHATPWKQDVESCDRVGLIQAMPAGDAEKDREGRQWEQRVELMRDAIIYNRNNPSILFYECGNKAISREHMIEMKAVRDKYDPFGGRAIGSREMLDIREAEYGGEMLYINRSEHHPMWATEYCRDEGLRKYWDEYSYPFHKEGDGPLYKGQPATDYNRNQDELAITMIARWYDYWRERPGTGNRVSSGGTKIIFSDTNTHYRGAENYRRSGVTDAMRIEKDAFYAHQVMWDGWVDTEKDQTYIIGHWNYPDNTVKPVQVVSTGEEVELFLNGNSLGKGKRQYNFLFTFDNVAFKPGKLEAVSYNKAGKEISRYAVNTAGEPASLKLTAIQNPEGFHADGADMTLIQVEVVDKDGQRCPLDNRTIQFTLKGQAEWRGGIAQGKNNHILDTNLPVECGINRALIRSTTAAGKVTLTAQAKGLLSASLTLETVPVKVTGGLSTYLPQATLKGRLDRGETPSTPSYKDSKKGVRIVSAKAGSNNNDAEKSYDDIELTEWKNDGKLSTAWITYTLERDAEIDDICIKLQGWRSRSYPLEVYAGNTLIWSGNTDKSLGYIHLNVEKPVRANTITIRLKGNTSDKDAFGQIIEVEAIAANTMELEKSSSKHQLRIIEVEFLETIK